MTLWFLLLAAIFLVVLLYVGKGYWAWVSALAIGIATWWLAGVASPNAFNWTVAFAVLAAIVFGLPAIRRPLVSALAMRLVRAILPTMGDTERIALEAGTVWWDGELFSGDPDWKKLLAFSPQPLSEREQDFLDGPVEELCRMLDDWQINQDRDLPPNVWEFLKRERFFGMIVPEEFGGLGFSAIGHSAVIVKVSSRSVTAAVTVMVPNSLGPAELILHYGTDKQKQHYLPRLASGEDVPCFALTEPHAGSDAASGRSSGVVCRGNYDGKDVLGMRLNWNKRYITLAPVATVIGLAFRLFDPDGLLGGEEDRGITCALIPRDVPGIKIGDRHDPMRVPFHNGPVTGTDVFVPVDFIIGGPDGAGQGWKMLMDSLAAGRSISLPSQSVAAVELAARATGAYATVREQFNMPIGRFEGIEEPLARIAGHAYLMNAVRVLTCAAVDAGEKPAVLSAVAKAYLTDAMRSTTIDAMDILAGSAISGGPRNIMSRVYVSAPIGITVEGANILTRTLIIFGQGSIRCHPFVHAEMQAVAVDDLKGFDEAFFGHLGHVYKNAMRSLLLGLTGEWLAATPEAGPAAKYYRALTRYSASFALVTDICLATLGGTLKRREKISGRLADVLAWLYLGSATLKRFHDEGNPDVDVAVLKWSCDLALWNIQEALKGVLDNLPNRLFAAKARFLVFPLGAHRRPPGDELGAEVARCLLDGNEGRLRLTPDIFIPAPDENGLGKLEAALEMVVAARDPRNSVRDAIKAGTLESHPEDTQVERAVAAGVISDGDAKRLMAAEAARDDVIQVDSFDPETYAGLKG